MLLWRRVVVSLFTQGMHFMSFLSVYFFLPIYFPCQLYIIQRVYLFPLQRVCTAMGSVTVCLRQPMRKCLRYVDALHIFIGLEWKNIEDFVEDQLWSAWIKSLTGSESITKSHKKMAPTQALIQIKPIRKYARLVSNFC